MRTVADISDLIIRVGQRDRKAFRPLYDATSQKLFGVLLRMLKSRSEAEEALQEVFFKIWRGAGKFLQGACSPISWLIAIARNHALDMIRQPSRILRASSTGERADHRDDRSDPELNAIHADFNRQIALRIADLAPLKALLIRGAYVEGCSYAELAVRHAMPVNTVRTWLRRALREMAGSDGGLHITRSHGLAHLA